MIKKMNQSLLRSERDWRSAALFPPGVVPPHSIDLDQRHFLLRQGLGGQPVRLASREKLSRHVSTGF
jgi:hypothetical protein